MSKSTEILPENVIDILQGHIYRMQRLLRGNSPVSSQSASGELSRRQALERVPSEKNVPVSGRVIPVDAFRRKALERAMDQFFGPPPSRFSPDDAS